MSELVAPNSVHLPRGCNVFPTENRIGPNRKVNFM